MTRSDLLVQLVKAGVANNQNVFRNLVETLIAEERAKEHHVLAKQLEEYLRVSEFTARAAIAASDERFHTLLDNLIPEKKLTDLCLPDVVYKACLRLIDEQHRRELLHSYGLTARNKILLVGPPGNGKTSLAEAIAEGLMVPFLRVRYSGLIGSYLGETSNRLQKLFDYVRSRSCVLFFDEFDTIGKERGDEHETGEIKRVVSGLLMQIDSLPSHVVIVTATNHPELLDKAVWRRFQLQLQLPSPGDSQICEWLQKFEEKLGQKFGVKLEKAILKKLSGLSFAELEEFCLNVHRSWVLSSPASSISKIVQTCLNELDRDG